MRIQDTDIVTASCYNTMEGKDLSGAAVPTDIKLEPTNNDVATSNGILSPPTTPSNTTPAENEYTSASAGSGRFKFFKGKSTRTNSPILSFDVKLTRRICTQMENLYWNCGTIKTAIVRRGTRQKVPLSGRRPVIVRRVKKVLPHLAVSLKRQRRFHYPSF